MASSTTNASQTFQQLLDNLLPQEPSPSHNLNHMILGPPGNKSLHPDLTAQIAALQLHPTLEATLHILNADLPSAHFLVRHMQSPPAVEGMLLHCILHRCEGDFRNAEAWAEDVCKAPKSEGFPGGDALVDAVYGWHDDAERNDSVLNGMIESVERIRGNGGKDEREVAYVEAECRKEMQRLVRWCSGRFGTGKWEDASEAWVRPNEKIKQIGQEQTTGDQGHRRF